MSAEIKEEQVLADAKHKIQTMMAKQKPNPNHYPIIDKWNYRYVYAPHRAKIFELLESTIDYMVESTIGDLLNKMNSEGGN